MNRRAALAISVSAYGQITSCNVQLPTKKQFIKPEKESYDGSRKHDYKVLSEQIAKKVAGNKALQRENAQLRKLVNKQSMKNVAKMFDRLIENSIPD